MRYLALDLKLVTSLCNAILNMYKINLIIQDQWKQRMWLNFEIFKSVLYDIAAPLYMPSEYLYHTKSKITEVMFSCCSLITSQNNNDSRIGICI